MTEHRRPLGAPPPEDLAPPWTAIIWLPGGCRYHVLSAHRSYAQAIGAAAQTTGARFCSALRAGSDDGVLGMISTTLTAEHRRVARLPFNYTATFIYSPEIGFDVAWEPNRPRIRSPCAQRPFFRTYEAQRNAFITELATMIGGSVLVADSPAARSPTAP